MRVLLLILSTLFTLIGGGIFFAVGFLALPDQIKKLEALGVTTMPEGMPPLGVIKLLPWLGLLLSLLMIVTLVQLFRKQKAVLFIALTVVLGIVYTFLAKNLAADPSAALWIYLIPLILFGLTTFLTDKKNSAA